MTARRRSVVRIGSLALGVFLFAATLYCIKSEIALETVLRLGTALPLAILFGGLWHLARTWGWAWCFPPSRQVGFLHLARVRLSAEAFSYLTLRGIAGEPLKVVLLSGSVDAHEATAAVALERLAYLVGTTVIVGIASGLALLSLPLTPLWFQVFQTFTIGAGAVTLSAILVVLGHGTYLSSLLGRLDAVLGTSLAEGRWARFVARVERQVLDLVRGNPTRLLVLVAATAASYLFMVLEAWVVLRASRASITPGGVLAVETLSRVASFATAFIPANIGALEASSFAAVAAVGAAGAGTALALARRIRGLFWAGLGLAIYPRARSTDDRAAGADRQTPAGPTLIYLPETPEVPVPMSAKLAGLPIAERVVRAAFRAGYSRVIVWAPHVGQGADAKLLRRLAHEFGDRLLVARVPHEWGAAFALLPAAEPVTIIGGGTVVSPALFSRARALPAETGRTVDVPAGPAWPESGVIRMTAGDARDRGRAASALAARHHRALPRPSGTEVSAGIAMLAIRIAEPAHLAAADETIRRASYKMTDAKIARFNRRISLPISVRLIPTPLTANQLSIVLVAIGFYSAWLFSLGHYWTGVLGALLSLAASVLDGCDGEIARLKYQESALGCWIETLGDYSYYIAIFVGLTIGAVRQTGWQGFLWLGGCALAGTLISFAILIFMRSRITAGQPEALHAVAKARFKSEPTFWSRIIWRISFVATRAAMPYGIMVFALIHALPGVVLLAAIGANVYWISLVLKMRHLLGTAQPVVAG